MPLPLEPLTPAPGSRGDAGLDFLSDVDVNVRIELGTARMHVQDVLKLGSGSVVPLESQVGDPVNVYVNDRLVARGEVLVVNDNFAIRITEVIPLPKTEK
jgi:flagellar motor switch protein FliN/FliY